MSNLSKKVKNKLTICLFTESYYPIVGGGETQGRIMAEDLVENGFQVFVITRRSNDDLKKFEKVGKISIYRVDPTGSSHLNRWIMLVTSLPNLIKLVRQYDIIFVSGFRSLGILAVFISKLFDKLCILKADNNGEMSGEYFQSGLAKWNLNLSSPVVKLFLLLRNAILRQADAFVSLSTEMSQEFLDNGVSKNKINLIYNSVDTQKFYPVNSYEKHELRKKLAIKLKEKVVVYTGRLLETKGLPLLVKVWKQIKTIYDDCQLLIVGGGSKDIHDCEAELKQYVKSNFLENSVKFTGDVYNVYKYLQASDIFVFPTENEAFGISLIEAMACGLPVISTPVGGIKDILTHEQNGLIFEDRNFEQLYNAISRLLDDDLLCKYLGSNALNTVSERYSRDVIAKKNIDLFQRLLKL